MTSDLLTGQKAQAYTIPCILAIKRVFVFLQTDSPSKNNLVLPSLPSVLYSNKSCTGNRPSELSNTISTYALITAVPDPSYIGTIHEATAAFPHELNAHNYRSTQTVSLRVSSHPSFSPLIPEKKLLFPDPLRPTSLVSTFSTAAGGEADRLHCAAD